MQGVRNFSVEKIPSNNIDLSFALFLNATILCSYLISIKSETIGDPSSHVVKICSFLTIDI